ncbi:DUF3791 domain-containing protein [Adlercreutzia sp. ZJ141]|uniref:DUF3791 domain-containing protein n=1 Tax=Adlercreutzia sp. ZJ141 TaxID=2709406 RepID=UPI0035303078
MVIVVNEYALSSGLTPKEAFLALRDCGGISLLEDQYEIEHTLPLSSTIDALTALVSRHKAATL